MKIFRLSSVALGFATAISQVHARPIEINLLDYQVTPQRTFISLNAATTEYNVFILDSPPRLVIDLKNWKPSKNLAQPSADHPYLFRLRSASRNQNDYRIVFDLKGNPDLKHFAVETEQSEHDQLIIVLSDDDTHANLQVETADEHTITNQAFSVSELSSTDKKTFRTPSPDTYPPVSAQRSDIRHGASADRSVFDTLTSDWEFSGYVGVESLGFIETPLDNRQHSHYFSGVIAPEFYRSWDNGSQSFTFVPFYRYSQHDSRRTHFDIRELTWLKSADTWELRTGFRQVFWGVTEGFHLIDIINQADFVEDIDGEQKLGQPMINLALIQDWGTIDLFLLPGFRERTFAGPEGRLRTHPATAVGDAQFERHGFEKHMAYAIRYSHTFGDWDVGLAHFYGTGRQPTMLPEFNQFGGIERIIPLYENINQTSIDIQTIQGSWLWKLEALMRSGQGDRFYAATGGVEYTLFDFFESGIDLGLIAEYMYDSRGYNNYQALTQQTIFQDDFLAAVRLGFNDIQNTQLLAGVIFDRTRNSKIYNIEASRRLGENWTADLQIRLFRGIPNTDPLIMFSADDHVRFQLNYHF